MQHPPIQLRSDSFTFTLEIALFCHFFDKNGQKSLKFRHFSDFLDLVFYLRGPTMTMELKLSNVSIRHDVVAVPVGRLEKRVATDQSKNLPITPCPVLMQKLACRS